MNVLQHEGSLMPKAYEFFDHTADIGVHVYGRTLEELFENAAHAMYEAMGSLARGKEQRVKIVNIEATSLEDLLHDWLAELLYEAETNHVLYDEFEITKLAPPQLVASLRGSSIDFTRSQTNEEIKAITYHQLRVEQLADTTCRATVIFDV
jgi:SHS2 domain-containing protein